MASSTGTGIAIPGEFFHGAGTGRLVPVLKTLARPRHRITLGRFLSPRRPTCNSCTMVCPTCKGMLAVCHKVLLATADRPG